MKKITKIALITVSCLAFAASLFSAGTADAHDNPPQQQYQEEHHKSPKPEKPPKHHDDHRDGPEHHK